MRVCERVCACVCVCVCVCVCTCTPAGMDHIISSSHKSTKNDKKRQKVASTLQSSASPFSDVQFLFNHSVRGPVADPRQDPPSHG